jgi:hypothetical protein
LQLNNKPSTCHHFIELINKRFNPPLMESPIGELALLRRDGSVDNYCNKFMDLSCRELNIALQVQLFTMGLRYPLCMDITLQKPSTLDEAVMFMQPYEWHNRPH